MISEATNSLGSEERIEAIKLHRRGSDSRNLPTLIRLHWKVAQKLPRLGENLGEVADR